MSEEIDVLQIQNSEDPLGGIMTFNQYNELADLADDFLVNFNSLMTNPSFADMPEKCKKCNINMVMVGQCRCLTGHKVFECPKCGDKKEVRKTIVTDKNGNSDNSLDKPQSIVIHDKLAEAKKLLESWGSTFQKEVQEQANRGNPYWPDWDNVENFIKKLLAAQDLISYERGREEGRKIIKGLQEDLCIKGYLKNKDRIIPEDASKKIMVAVVTVINAAILLTNVFVNTTI